MAKRVEGEYVSFALDTSNIRYKALDGSDSYVQNSAQTLSNFTKIISGLERAIRSSTGESGFNINRNLTTVDSSSETGFVKFYVNKKFEKLVKEVITNFESKSNLVGDLPEALSKSLKIEDVVKLIYKKTNIEGNRAKNAMIVEAHKAGGFAERVNEDTMLATLFASEEQLNNMTDTQLYNKVFAGSNSMSRSIKRKNKQLAKQKHDAYLADLAKDFYTPQDKLDATVNKLMTKAEVQEEKEKDKENKSHSPNSPYLRSQGANARKTLRMLGMIGGSLVLIADITRRILTATLSRAVKAEQMATEAHNLGMNYEEVRRLEVFDKTKGLPEGTHMRGISDVQTFFGDTTHINEQALGVLARVMGEGVSDMVLSGQGNKEPEELLKNIMNSFFNNFLQGKNSLGIEVGQEQARRELITVLKGLSPSWANIFAKMTEDYSSGINRKKFNDYEGWLGTTKYGDYLTNGQKSGVQALGEVVNEINGMLHNFKTNIMENFLLSLGNLLDKANNLEIGLSPEQVLETRKSKQQMNSADLSTYKTVLEGTEESLRNDLKKKYGIEEIPDIKKDPTAYTFFYDLIMKGDAETINKFATMLEAEELISKIKEELKKPLTERITYNDFANSFEGFNANVSSRAQTMIANVLNAVRAGQGKVVITNDDGTTTMLDLTPYNQAVREGTRGFFGMYKQLSETNPELFAFYKRLFTESYSENVAMPFFRKDSNGKAVEGEFTLDDDFIKYLSKEAYASGTWTSGSIWEWMAKGGANPYTLLGGDNENIIVQAFARWLADKNRDMEVMTASALTKGLNQSSLDLSARLLATDLFSGLDVSKMTSQGYDFSKTTYKVNNQQITFSIPLYVNGKETQRKTVTAYTKDMPDVAETPLHFTVDSAHENNSTY